MWQYNGQTARPLSIHLSDIHLCAKCPPARAEKHDWDFAVGRSFINLRILQLDLQEVPIFVAGDIFDNAFRGELCPPELTNFAIQQFSQLKDVYAIPGQHDLPNHRYDMLHRTAYQTLVCAGVLKDMSSYETFADRYVIIHPKYSDVLEVCAFPWRTPVVPHNIPEPEKSEFTFHRICVAHKYVWTGESVMHDSTGHVRAEKEDLIGNLEVQLQGYDAAFFGDNHKGFPTAIRIGNCEVLNTGAFIRRKADEYSYRPAVGVYYSNGRILKQYMDTSHERWDVAYMQESQAERKKEPRDFSDYIKEMRELATGDNLRFFDLIIGLWEKMSWDQKATENRTKEILDEIRQLRRRNDVNE